MKKAALAVVALLLAYLLFWPTQLEPEVWTPPPPFPLESTPCATPTGLEKTAILVPDLGGPEAIYVDDDGSLVTGTLDGRVMRVSTDGARSEEIGKTGGRPLGIKKLADGRYVIADAHRGLIAMSRDGKVEVLAASHDGKPFKFADDLDVARDGTVYFTDASQRWGVEDWRRDVIEHGRTGRVLSWDPSTKKTTVLVDGLSFANGVALAPDDSYVAFTELNEYALKRYWLSGEKKGSVELIALLPGFPDNVTLSKSRGLFWVAIGSPRQAIVESMADTPWLRHVVMRLPQFMQPKPLAHAFVVGVDGSGAFVHCLQHIGDDAYYPVASAIEHEGSIYLGSFKRSGIGKAPAPPP